MSFDWAEYLHLAHELADSGRETVSTEACLRSSISRAYYAVFGAACIVLLRKDKLNIPRYEAHAFVIREYKSSPYRRRRSIGANLERMRDDRNKADYDGTVVGLPLLTRKTLMLADSVIKEIGHLMRDDGPST